ncbi:hypothetical protein PIB30_097236 [Stylosanthes scabra]|uniref:2-oxo-4-hydroxy-4-carboxy-5-ureidoimidazoline decarboxylase n=1 Tax=Stylosanthes scabra TaxID=79078 RepID=A0ABU6TVR1_9FABA|nr:hypothetical protein [Stylosanthes scabra]
MMDFYRCSTNIWFAKDMVAASPFSSLEHATSFVRDMWFKESSIHSWLYAISEHSHIKDAFVVGRAPIMQEILQWGKRYREKFGFGFITSMDKHLSQQILNDLKTRCENSLIVELEVASWEEFKFIENDLALLWQRLVRDSIQWTAEEETDFVEDSLDKEDVETGDNSGNSGEIVSTAGSNSTMLSFDLNKTHEENMDTYH